MNERQFYAVIEAWRVRGYDWDESNCCQFAADVAYCWGLDIDVPVFDSVDNAVKWIKSKGSRSLYHYLVKLFGKPVAPLQAKRGFIAYRKGQGLDGSAIGTIDRRALFVGDKGLVEVRLGDCAAAFNPMNYREQADR